jgi:hypothetical protein
MAGAVTLFNPPAYTQSPRPRSFPARRLDCFAAGLTDPGTQVMHSGNCRTLIGKDGDHSVMMWDDEMALFITADIENDFFEDEEHAARYGIVQEQSWADVAVEVVDVAPNAEPAPPEAAKPAAKKTKKGTRKKAPVREEAVVEIVEAPAEIAYDSSAALPENPDIIVEATTESVSDSDNWAKKNKLAADWTTAYARIVFNKTEDATSILDNEDYRGGVDKAAVASLYISSVPELYKGMISGLPGNYLGAFMKDYRNMNMHLYLGRQTARLTCDMTLSDVNAAAFRKIYSRPINPAFARYVAGNQVVGFMGYSIDTKAYLEELPKMIEQSYSRMLGFGKDYREEASIGRDFFSLLLDEQAVAEVLKGDMLLLFNGVSQKTGTYTTYDYDGDTYERKEVQKTKTETLPDFLPLVSSGDTRLIRKVLNYGINKGEVELRNGIYILSGKSMKSPMKLHLLMKDGIVFIGTSLAELKDIRDDRFEAQMSQGQRSLLLDNNISMYFNPRKLKDKIPQKEIGSFRKWTQMNDFLGNTGVMYARSNGINGNAFSSEIVVEIPNGSENALKYFFSLIDDLDKND